MYEDDGLDIPDFLKRSKNEVAPPPPAPKRTRTRKPTAEQEREREVRRIADRRWRQWLPSAETGLRRPRITTFRKLVRAELRRRDARQAMRDK